MFLQAMLWEQNARYGALEMVRNPLSPKGYRPIDPVKFSLAVPSRSESNQFRCDLNLARL